ncbi:MAG: hypothetical protein AAFP69_12960 [Planctomycetota bacterium]
MHETLMGKRSVEEQTVSVTTGRVHHSDGIGPAVRTDIVGGTALYAGAGPITMQLRLHRQMFDFFAMLVI